MAGERLAVDPNNGAILYFGSRCNGLWKSSDSGANWSQVAQFPANSDPQGIGITIVRFIAGSGTSDKATPLIYAGVASKTTALDRSTDAGATWTAVSGQPTGLYPFHGALASDGWKSFVTAASPVPPHRDTPHATPDVEGDIWLAANNNGLYHSTDSGATFTRVSSVQQAYSIGLGAPPITSPYPALYLSGMVGGLKAIYRSDDHGATWVRINDDQHQVGGFVIGDPRVYGRVYLGTNGRGIFYADLVERIVFTGRPPQSCQPSTATVEALASDGTPVPHVTIAFQSKNATLSAAEATTDAQGLARITVMGRQPGPASVTASVAGLAPAVLTVAGIAITDPPPDMEQRPPPAMKPF